MPVDTQLGRVGEVAAEFEKERAEVAVHAVEIELVDHRCRADQPGIGRAGCFVAPPFGAKHGHLLLRLANEHHALFLGELLPVLGGHIVFALALAKLNHGNLLSFGKLFQGCHEHLADRIHQCAGGKLKAPVKAKERGYSLLPLELWDVHVQVHPVDSLHLQGDVLVEHFGNAAWYAHFRLRLTPVLRDHPPLCGPMTEPFPVPCSTGANTQIIRVTSARWKYTSSV